MRRPSFRRPVWTDLPRMYISPELERLPSDCTRYSALDSGLPTEPEVRVFRSIDVSTEVMAVSVIPKPDMV